ncbi:hypothetical protein K402DRAFT_403962 [Aulographum hederae CBS 113979]|uniref:Uncharacterized protein n=1 Tax=Aulographum hederae CBS 113979 TaxID=1176131 RepID=A0A6G1H257_9PEZI|nr:hypothetical protein K402DRAFT_403962 [Aulographum hederae CBS 113979]
MDHLASLARGAKGVYAAARKPWDEREESFQRVFQVDRRWNAVGLNRPPAEDDSDECVFDDGACVVLDEDDIGEEDTMYRLTTTRQAGVPPPPTPYDPPTRAQTAYATLLTTVTAASSATLTISDFAGPALTAAALSIRDSLPALRQGLTGIRNELRAVVVDATYGIQETAEERRAGDEFLEAVRMRCSGAGLDERELRENLLADEAVRRRREWEELPGAEARGRVRSGLAPGFGEDDVEDEDGEWVDEEEGADGVEERDYAMARKVVPATKRAPRSADWYEEGDSDQSTEAARAGQDRALKGAREVGREAGQNEIATRQAGRYHAPRDEVLQRARAAAKKNRAEKEKKEKESRVERPHVYDSDPPEEFLQEEDKRKGRKTSFAPAPDGRRITVERRGW